MTRHLKGKRDRPGQSGVRGDALDPRCASSNASAELLLSLRPTASPRRSLAPEVVCGLALGCCADARRPRTLRPTRGCGQAAGDERRCALYPHRPALTLLQSSLTWSCASRRMRDHSDRCRGDDEPGEDARAHPTTDATAARSPTSDDSTSPPSHRLASPPQRPRRDSSGRQGSFGPRPSPTKHRPRSFDESPPFSRPSLSPATSCVAPEPRPALMSRQIVGAARLESIRRRAARPAARGVDGGAV